MKRPWVLEVWELSNDSAELEWCTWSTTIEAKNALKIREKLLSKGHQARVRNSVTGEILGEEPIVCAYCDKLHAEPFDGTCLL
jgi:hypothetical protein